MKTLEDLPTWTQYSLFALSMIVLILITLQGASASLTDGLIGYWSMDDGSGTNIVNSVPGGVNGTATAGEPVNITGLIGNARNQSGAADKNIVIGSNICQFGLGNFSVSLWYKYGVKPGSGNKGLFGNLLSSGAYNGVGAYIESNGAITYITHDYGSGNVRVQSYGSGYNITTGWNHFVFVRNTTAVSIYYDGAYLTGVNGAAVNTTVTTGNCMLMDCYQTGASYSFSGGEDEVAFYNRSLNLSEIQQLYNGGAGNAYSNFSGGSGASISLTANLPANNTHQNTQPLNYSVNLTTTNAANCTLFINGTSNQTKTAQTTGTITFNTTSTEGSQYWWVNCTDGTINAQSANRTVVIDYTNPVWTINSIATDNSTVKNKNVLFQFNDTCSDTNLYAANITMTAPNGTVIYSKQNTSITGTTWNDNDTVNLSTVTPGKNFSINYYCEDSHTAVKINDYANIVDLPSASINYVTDTGTNVTIKGVNKNGTITGITTWKNVDRYQWQFNWSTNASHQILINVSSTTDAITDLSGQYGNPDFVIGLHWLDFKLQTPFTYTVTRVGNSYLVWMNATEKVWTFSSLGGLNVANISYNFSVNSTSIQSARISPTTATANGTLLGYCNATGDPAKTMSYNYVWYLNGAQNATGTLGGFTQGVEANVANLTTGLVKGQTWILQCQGNDSTDQSYKLNSSSAAITNTGPAINLQNTFTNATGGHWFTIKAGATDADGANDLNFTNISSTSGTCTYLSNTTAGNNMNVTYNCTGTPYTSTTIQLNFTDSAWSVASTTASSNSYPNNAPVMNTSRISPSTAYYNDTLLGYCNATDASNDTLIYNYIWYLNGAQNATGTLGGFTQGVEANVANLTTGLAKGQNWTFSCQANDSWATSSWLNSSTLTISNTPPLNNFANYSIPHYQATRWGACSDADGDSVTTTTNDTHFTGETGSFGWLNFAANLSYSGLHAVQVNCSDGTDTSSKTIYINITNTAPVNNWSVQNFTQNHNASAFFGPYCTDADNDALFFSTNNSIFPILTNGSINFTANVSNSGYYALGVSCSDTNQNTTTTTYFNITNQAPNITSVNLTPQNPALSDNITCNVACNDPDGDTCTGTAYQWWKNNTLLNYTNATLRTGNYTLSDNITCTARVNDTNLWSDWQNSTTLTLGDTTAPSITNFSITPNSINTAQTTNISAICTDANTVSSAQAEITTPGPVTITNYTMTGDANGYSFTYAGNTIGTYSIKVYCADGNGNIANTTPQNLIITQGVVNVGGGGGGSGSPLKEQKFTLIAPLTGYVNPYCPTGEKSPYFQYTIHNEENAPQTITVSQQNLDCTLGDMSFTIPANGDYNGTAGNCSCAVNGDTRNGNIIVTNGVAHSTIPVTLYSNVLLHALNDPQTRLRLILVFTGIMIAITALIYIKRGKK